MDRFINQNLEILIEEQFDSTNADNNENFVLGRLYCQAPEIDGATVISETGFKDSRIKMKPGNLVMCKIISRRGFDLEARLI
jgi:ribosomal protein S12 methylthiotransferase